MNKTKRVLLVVVLLVFIVTSGPSDLTAQCVMCKAVAEDSASDGGLGAGLNRGILYLMAIPYILLCALFFVIYKEWKAKSTT